jgi:hypothetical protein
MKLVKLSFIVFSSMGVLFLGAYNNSEAGATNNPEPVTKTENIPTTTKLAATQHSKPSKGDQVLEVGKYHLEFVPEPEKNVHS